MMKKTFLIIILILMQSNFIHSNLLELENEFIKIIGDTDTGRFILKTTGGDPAIDSDQDSLLLYEDYPPTSFTTIQIDGKEYKFGDETGMFISRMQKRDDYITTVWSVKNFDIRQTLKIVKGPTTGNHDTLEILYDVVNKGRHEYDVGIRIMLDTYIGKEDGAPYRIPEAGNITEEKMLCNNEVPAYWYSYDDLSKPSIIAQGTLRIDGSPPPEKIVFASWERFNKYLWDFKIKAGRSFRRSIIGPLDSALAMYWKTGKMKPNANYTIKTYYGLMSKEAIPTKKVFKVTLNGLTETTGNPIVIKAEIQNTTKFKIKNVMAEMILPPGLKFNFNETKDKNLASLEKKQLKNTSWSILPDKSKIGKMKIQVKVTGQIQDKSVSEIAEIEIEYKQVEYTLIDFSAINQLLQQINVNKNANNEKISDINKKISLKEKAKYEKNEVEQDRQNIKTRKNEAKEINNKIPDAVKSAIKHEKK